MVDSPGWERRVYRRTRGSPAHSRVISGSRNCVLWVIGDQAGSSVALAADHRNPPRANQLDDLQGTHHFDKGLDLSFLSGNFDDHGFRGHVDDASAENLRQLGNLR